MLLRTGGGMSRLDEEFIIGIVRERSGIDSGQIAISENGNRFDRMSEGFRTNQLLGMNREWL